MAWGGQSMQDRGTRRSQYESKSVFRFPEKPIFHQCYLRTALLLASAAVPTILAAWAEADTRPTAARVATWRAAREATRTSIADRSVAKARKPGNKRFREKKTENDKRENRLCLISVTV